MLSLRRCYFFWNKEWMVFLTFNRYQVVERTRCSIKVRPSWSFWPKIHPISMADNQSVIDVTKKSPIRKPGNQNGQPIGSVPVPKSPRWSCKRGLAKMVTDRDGLSGLSLSAQLQITAWSSRVNFSQLPLPHTNSPQFFIRTGCRNYCLFLLQDHLTLDASTQASHNHFCAWSWMLDMLSFLANYDMQSMKLAASLLMYLLSCFLFCHDIVLSW